MKRKTLCELIQRRLAGGDVSDDFSPKLAEINLWLNHGIAASAVKNYTDAVKIDGIEFVSDAFYLTITDLTIYKDETTGWYFADLPAAPWALPPGYDISWAKIQGSGYLSKGMVRTNPNRRAVHEALPKIPNKLYWWVDTNRLYIDSFTALQHNKLAVRMAGSAGSTYSGGLDDTLRVPDDAIPYIMEYVLRVFGQKVVPDMSNDNVDQK